MGQNKSETVFSGIGVSHGIAIGKICLVQVEHPVAPRQGIDPGRLIEEKARFRLAVETVQEDMAALRIKAQSLPDPAAEEVTLMLDAHLGMLSGSRLVRGVLEKIERNLVNAESALEDVLQDLAAQFTALKDPYISARLEDVRAVTGRLMRALLGVPYVALGAVTPGSIVIAKEISPADAAHLDPRLLAGLATVHGGAAGHTAVMTRSLGLPAVLGLDSAILDSAGQGCMAVVDGIAGKLIFNPSPETLGYYQRKTRELTKEKETLGAAAGLPSLLKSGESITIRANLELPREASAILSSGAEGIGLFRTEFLFMGRKTLPGEEEQFLQMAEVVKAMQGKAVTFRTLDIGGDKLAAALGPWIGEAANPALGLRAIRLSLRAPDLLKTQFRAMLRAAALGPVRILLPMVTTAGEVETARRIMKSCYHELKSEGVKIPEMLPPLGVMIEIPAAALSADSLAAVSDFFALGTNDLVQYTVAIDRSNDQVAALYNPLNPAVLRLMEFAIEAGLRAGIPVSICGEMGADPLYTPLLIGLGIREFSAGAANIPRLKARIRELDLSACSAHARLVMDQYDAARTAEIVARFRA